MADEKTDPGMVSIVLGVEDAKMLLELSQSVNIRAKAAKQVARVQDAIEEPLNAAVRRLEAAKEINSGIAEGERAGEKVRQ